MASLNFTKLLCGPSVDIFTKDFVHSNTWEVEHVSKGPTAELNNNVFLGKFDELGGVSTLKHDFSKFSSELKLKSDGTHYLDVFGKVPFLQGLKFGSKFVYNVPKATHSLTLSSEHVNENVSSRVELLPFEQQYNAFGLFHFGSAKKCLLGVEVSGTRYDKLDYTVGGAFKHEFDDKSALFVFRLFGTNDRFFSKFVGNFYLAKDEPRQPLAAGVSVEQVLGEPQTKLSFCGLWHLTPLDHPQNAFVKAKCDSSANVALALGQKLSNKLTLTFGVEFNAKKPVAARDLNYGLKLSLTD